MYLETYQIVWVAIFCYFIGFLVCRFALDEKRKLLGQKIEIQKLLIELQQMAFHQALVKIDTLKGRLPIRADNGQFMKRGGNYDKIV